MKRFFTWLKRGLFALALLLPVTVGAGLVYRAVIQSRGEAVLALGPSAIDEQLYVPTRRGTVIGVDMARKRPDLLAAHVGTGEPSAVEFLAQMLVAPRYTLLDEVSYVRGMLASADHFMGTGAMDGPCSPWTCRRRPPHSGCPSCPFKKPTTPSRRRSSHAAISMGLRRRARSMSRSRALGTMHRSTIHNRSSRRWTSTCAR